MTMMSIEQNETSKAFRVNGVTVAKKHLQKLFTGDDIDDKIRLSMYLATVPDLYMSGAAEFIIEKSRDDSPAKYGAHKAMRLWNALKLTPGIVRPFQMACLEMAGPKAKKHIERRVKETLDKNPQLKNVLRPGEPDFVGDADGNNVIQFPKKPTVH